MKIAFYIDEMNYRGVANSTYQYAFNNQKILKNKSIIFYNNKNYRNKIDVIKKFKKEFKTYGISHFKKIEKSKIKNIDFIYVQKGGKKDTWVSTKIKTLVHSIYPQKIDQIHGFKYILCSEWLSKEFYNYKIPYVPYMVNVERTKKSLIKNLKINKNFTVFGCHGGESSFDIQFVKDVIKKVVHHREDIVFLFLNINKFYNHPRVIFLKGTSNENYKKKFLNTCDAMIYGRSLGESFGLACAEFASQGKKIFSYKFNRHRSHVFDSIQGLFEEYYSFNSLFKKLIKFKKNKRNKFLNYKYKNYSSAKVMRVFNKVFLKSKEKKDINLLDYLINLRGRFIMNSLYLMHKLYHHYYKFFYPKI